MNTGPASTIAIIPRETFRTSAETIRRVLAHTPDPRRIVVIDGGSPRHVRRELLRLARDHDLMLVRSDVPLGANEARNLAMAHIDTEFAVFVDNDTLVQHGWLHGLERCADETGATLVVPAVLWGPTGFDEVHFAGGVCHIVDERGTRRLEIHNLRMHEPVASLDALSRQRTELAEMHCFLARTDDLRDLGPFDESLLAAREEADFGLRLAEHGRAAWLEPAVVVGYPSPKRVGLTDLPFFLPRWSPAWTDRSFVAFNAKWNLNATAIDDVFRDGHKARRIGVWPGSAPGMWGWTRRIAWKARRTVDVVATPLVARVQDERRRRASEPRVVHRASWNR